MSKDPAVLFYTADFLVGTSLMTDEQVGKYIRLLCLQHQKGGLTESHMNKVCNSHDEDIFNKFEKFEDGLYYNVRMKEEADKRRAYSDSRRKNRTKKDMINISKTYDKHMENENENEDINNKKVSTTKKSLTQRQKEFENECLALVGHETSYGKVKHNEARKFYNHYSAPLTAKPNMMLKESLKTWSIKGRIYNWMQKKEEFKK